MTALTRRQKQILAFLRDCARDDEAPSLADICTAFGLQSRGSLHKHIRALIEADLVEAMDGRRRGVRLTAQGAENLEGLPLLGRIAAGSPIEAVPDDQFIRIPPQLRGNSECYVLQVRGDSMIDDGIFDGDWVVVEHRQQARNGELVVALIDGTSATLKRIHQQPDRIVLIPANTNHDPQHYTPERVTIQGVVVGQMRRY